MAAPGADQGPGGSAPGIVPKELPPAAPVLSPTPDAAPPVPLSPDVAAAICCEPSLRSAAARQGEDGIPIRVAAKDGPPGSSSAEHGPSDHRTPVDDAPDGATAEDGMSDGADADRTADSRKADDSALDGRAAEGSAPGRAAVEDGRSLDGAGRAGAAASRPWPAGSPPGLVLSLPDVRCCRPQPELGGSAPAAVTPPSHAAAAASSSPATGESSASRLSAGSGIRRAPQSTASRTSHASPMSSVGPFCRICHEGESRELLISPCRCAGSVGLVHVSCIEKWLSAANKDSCEICMYKYVTERRPKPLFEWLLNPSSPEDARNLLGDVICFFLLTALAVIAAYLCLMGASHYLSYKTQWEATGLVVLGLLISSIYFIWLVVTCRYHWRVWHDWRHTHQDVHLLEMKRRSHSTLELNNNSQRPAAGGGSGPAPLLPPVLCLGCQGGSYSCARCCACPHHAVQLEAAAADDDVFEEGGAPAGLCGLPADNGAPGGRRAK